MKTEDVRQFLVNVIVAFCVFGFTCIYFNSKRTYLINPITQQKRYITGIDSEKFSPLAVATFVTSDAKITILADRLDTFETNNRQKFVVRYIEATNVDSGYSVQIMHK